MSGASQFELAAEARQAIGPALHPGRVWLARFLRNRLAVGAGIILFFLALAALLAPLIENLSGLNPESIDLFNDMAPPSAAHPLGTDELGRDLLIRLIYGGRISLAAGLLAALGAAMIGAVIGVLAGYYGGALDRRRSRPRKARVSGGSSS